MLLSSFMLMKPADKPTFYLIGDSTVKNGKGKGDGGLWGWGNYIAAYFDTTKIAVENDALGGTSSRTFQTMGLWDKVLAKVKPGDFVIMQFGHNDSGTHWMIPPVHAELLKVLVTSSRKYTIQ
jgi:rhamnogalacturonan acetylesterase